MRIKSSLLYGIILCLGCVLNVYAQQTQQTTNKEEIILTTFYPVPYGDYKQMRVQQMVVGKKWFSAKDACWEQGKCTEVIDENTVLVVDGNVGIGAYNPANRLAVSGAMSIGSGYASKTAPENGLIVEGNAGCGTPDIQTKNNSTSGYVTSKDVWLADANDGKGAWASEGSASGSWCGLTQTVSFYRGSTGGLIRDSYCVNWLACNNKNTCTTGCPSGYSMAGLPFAFDFNSCTDYPCRGGPLSTCIKN